MDTKKVVLAASALCILTGLILITAERKAKEEETAKKAEQKATAPRWKEHTFILPAGKEDQIYPLEHELEIHPGDQVYIRVLPESNFIGTVLWDKRTKKPQAVYKKGHRFIYKEKSDLTFLLNKYSIPIGIIIIPEEELVMGIYELPADGRLVSRTQKGKAICPRVGQQLFVLQLTDKPHKFYFVNEKGISTYAVYDKEEITGRFRKRGCIELRAQQGKKAIVQVKLLK